MLLAKPIPHRLLTVVEIRPDPGFDHFTRVMPLGTTTLHLYATAGQNPSGDEDGAPWRSLLRQRTRFPESTWQKP